MKLELSHSDYREIIQTVYETCGIFLDESKGYLIESRFKRLLQKYNCVTVVELARKVKYQNDKELIGEFINAITTRETHFFRDGTPFESLENKIFPELIAAKSGSPYARRLRIWSAACSSGQEIYSIAISLHKLLHNFDGWDILLLGTDISEAAITKASRGVYSKFEIERGLKNDDLEQYFTQEAAGWKVNDNIQSLVTFERRNLLNSFRELGPFDIIFCRNVAIYFDLRDKRDLFERISNALTPDGFLFVGSAESLADFGPKFVPQNHGRSVFYQPNRQCIAENQ